MLQCVKEALESSPSLLDKDLEKYLIGKGLHTSEECVDFLEAFRASMDVYNWLFLNDLCMVTDHLDPDGGISGGGQVVAANEADGEQHSRGKKQRVTEAPYVLRSIGAFLKWKQTRSSCVETCVEASPDLKDRIYTLELEVHTYVHTYIHVYIYTYIHTYIYTYAKFQFIPLFGALTGISSSSPTAGHLALARACTRFPCAAVRLFLHTVSLCFPPRRRL